MRWERTAGAHGAIGNPLYFRFDQLHVALNLVEGIRACRPFSKVWSNQLRCTR